MSQTCSRRDFIRIAGMGLASAAVADSLLRPGPGARAGQAAAPMTGPTPTYCEICFWKCAAWVHKDAQGGPWKIIGNPADHSGDTHPLSVDPIAEQVARIALPDTRPTHG